jgi:hypothetical protein
MSDLTSQDLGVFVLDFLHDLDGAGVDSFEQVTIIVRSEEGEVMQRTSTSDSLDNIELLCDALALEHRTPLADDA